MGKTYSEFQLDNCSTVGDYSQVGIVAVRYDEFLSGYVDENGIEVIEGTGEVLTDTSSTGKIRDWSGKKQMNLKLVGVLKSFRVKYSELFTSNRLNQIVECANYLKFGITGEKTKKLVEANFCRFKLCPMCQWRRSLKMFSQVSLITEKLNHDYPGSRYIFVTFTIKNVLAGELSVAIDRLNQGFKNLVQSSRKFADAKVFKDSLLGYLKCLEVTYNARDKTYHPHIHAIFHLKSSYFGKNYISRDKWVSLWRSMMKLDYEPQVNVKAIKKSESGTNPKLLAEIAKYPIKTSDILSISNASEQIEVIATLVSRTYHRRFITFGGTFRVVKRQLVLDDVEEGDLVHIESDNGKLNYVAYEIYKYNLGFGCYIC